MVVNTINDLVALLNLADQDVTVLGAISNDAATATGSGVGPGLVTTRNGSSVKNVQKVIADIENGITTGIRPAIQEEGVTVLDNAATWNFVGNNITITDISGVATVTLAGVATLTGTETLFNKTLSDTTVEGDLVVTAGTGTLNVSGSATTQYSGGILWLSNGATSGNFGVTFASQVIGADTTGSSYAINEVDAAGAYVKSISNYDHATSIFTHIQYNYFNSGVGVTGNITTSNGYVTTAHQVNAQTGTTYTTVLTDANAMITMSNAASNVFTIDPVATTAYPVGFTCEIIQLGAGATTIQAGAAVNLNGVAAGGGVITAQYDVVKIRHVASDTWIVDGVIGTIA
jgi:hypothetical protein